MTASLFDPIRLGAIEAPNRVLMAPLTRARGTRAHVPTPIRADYYAQRAGAGLIISEATGIRQQGLGWPYAPDLWSDEQVAAWLPVTAAVHRAGGRIVAQLWHMGRLVHSDFLGRARPVSSAAVAAPGEAHTYEGKKPHSVPSALAAEEIPGLLGDYRGTARNAMEASFDGVQIHAANGYLIDQFLRDTPNRRDDAYGGSIERRIRLLCEVTEAVAAAVGADRTAVRLSPNGAVQGCDDGDPKALFVAAAACLSPFGLAFLELREPGPDSTFRKADTAPVAPAIREVFKGPLVLNSDYRGAEAQAALRAGLADAIAFGRTFIANPDLPHRLAHHLPLAQDDMVQPGTGGIHGLPASGCRHRLTDPARPPDAHSSRRRQAAPCASAHRQERDRALVERARAEAVQCSLEHRLARPRRMREEGHARAELGIVRRPEDGLQRAAFEAEDRAGAQGEAFTQDRVGEEGGRLRERADGVEHRRPRRAEPAHLGENEPHPVGPLAAGAQLGENGGEHRLLRAHEAGEVERVMARHAGAPIITGRPGSSGRASGDGTRSMVRPSRAVRADRRPPIAFRSRCDPPDRRVRRSLTRKALNSRFRTLPAHVEEVQNDALSHGNHSSLKARVSCPLMGNSVIRLNLSRGGVEGGRSVMTIRAHSMPICGAGRPGAFTPVRLPRLVREHARGRPCCHRHR